MATAQQTKQEAMSKINGVMAALNQYPDLNTTNTLFSYSNSTNPMDLLVDFFKTTKGYDWLITAISKFIAVGLPVLELSVKTILLTNIRTILSCSTNPLITEQMIQEGVVFNLNRVDLFNMFKYSPLNRKKDNPGKYLYFGCTPKDGINDFTDLKYSRDFNAVLWYTKNAPGERVVWRRKGDVGKPYNISKRPIQGAQGNQLYLWAKQVKSNGIATIQYNGRSSGLSKADGGQMYVQEPIENCIHVFIGHCAPEQTGAKTKEIDNCTKLISKFNDFYDEIEEYKSKIRKGKRAEKNNLDNATAEELSRIRRVAKEDLALINRIKYAIDGVNINNPSSTETAIDVILGGTSFVLQTLHETITIPNDFLGTNRMQLKARKVNLLEEDATKTVAYPDPKSNYYYRHPLFEWNTDFVMSMKLFDEKVVASLLIDAITGCLSSHVEASISFQNQFLQEQLKEMIQKVIETDEGSVSDCFFSFTNDSYNAMLNEVELNRANLHTTNNQTVNVIPSADEVMDSLNTLSDEATKEELTSAVSGSLFSAVACSTPANVPQKIKPSLEVNFNANMSIIDLLLEMLVFAIVNVILQPKIYVLLMSNLKFLGGEPNFDLTKFFSQFADLISDIIKTVRDNILEYFKNEMMDILSKLTKSLAVKLTLEQYQYYIALLTHCTDCLKLHGNEFDWEQADVNYADITELNQEVNQEC